VKGPWGFPRATARLMAGPIGFGVPKRYIASHLPKSRDSGTFDREATSRVRPSEDPALRVVRLVVGWPVDRHGHWPTTCPPTRDVGAPSWPLHRPRPPTTRCMHSGQPLHDPKVRRTPGAVDGVALHGKSDQAEHEIADVLGAHVERSRDLDETLSM